MARPTDFDTDFAPAAFEHGSRAAAFSRAARHSRRVRVLKFLLPVATVAIAVAFVGYSFMATPVQTAVKSEDAAFTEGKLVMNSPKLEGFTKDGRPYTVIANKATQDVNAQDTINLDGIDARMPVEKENWATVKAGSGVYDRSANTLAVPTDILVTTTDGMVAKLKSAFLDIEKGSLKSDTPVDIQSHGSRVTANSMSVHDNGKLVIFETQVRVYIEPKQMKAAQTERAAQAEKGGANASN